MIVTYFQIRRSSFQGLGEDFSKHQQVRDFQVRLSPSQVVHLSIWLLVHRVIIVFSPLFFRIFDPGHVVPTVD